MSTQAPESAAPEVLLAASAAYAAEQQEARRELVLALLAAWATLEVRDVLGSWAGGLSRRMFVLVSMLQEMSAQRAQTHVWSMLALQRLRPEGNLIEPLTFAGLASDGRDLESLLAGSVVQVRRSQRAGEPDARALERGAAWLIMAAQTQVADAQRAAESVTITADGARDDAGRAVETGWVRMLTPPSCSRCAILAGRFYRWSDGFERHPNCDCTHIPATRDIAPSIVVDPVAYFESLTPAEQDYYFGKAVAQSIRDGANMEQVVNATTKPGAMFESANGKRYTRVGARNGIVRPTPWQIYRDAGGDRGRAVELLRQFRYLK